VNSYWDGERLISVRSIEALPYHKYEVMSEYLPCVLDFDRLLEGSDEETVHE
jgi:hypothetical protein